jgi:pyrimidine 5'-nucleotidase
MPINTLFFDLDATLHPESNGLWPAIRERIGLYMREVMHLPEGEISRLREHYYVNYGTTLRGLQTQYNIDTRAYLDFVHNLPLDEYLQPDPELRALLLSLPQRRWIFTNSDRPHTERVLETLGIADCFEGIVDVYALEPYCKPQVESYRLALDLARVAAPEDCALLDDSTRNLAPAHEMGIFTVLVGSNGANPAADRTLADIHDLPQAVPEFWEKQGTGKTLTLL